MTGDPPPTDGKVDPETLVLRSRPRTAVRIRRSVVIGGAATAAAAIAILAWFAFEPPSLRTIAIDRDRPDLRAQQPNDILAKAPPTYGDIPRLGPPLPGDLGRPILARQRELGLEGGNGSLEPSAEEQAQLAERQRIAAERDAARKSAVLVALQSDQSAASRSLAERLPIGGAMNEAMREKDAGTSEASGAAALTPAARKAAFLGNIESGGDHNPHPLIPPASPYPLSAGSIIPASLVTGLNSDVPGLVTAQVTQNVYDSANGRVLLIPQGTRLVGRYNHDVAYGQSRALVSWNRILFPDGSSMRIDNWTGSDAGGYAGLEDRVDQHSWQLLKGVVLSSLLGVGTGFALERDGADLVDALLVSSQQGAAQAGDKLVTKSLDVQPTIKVRPGWPVTVIVERDLLLKPWTSE